MVKKKKASKKRKYPECYFCDKKLPKMADREYYSSHSEKAGLVTVCLKCSGLGIVDAFDMGFKKGRSKKD